MQAYYCALVSHAQPTQLQCNHPVILRAFDHEHKAGFGSSQGSDRRPLDHVKTECKAEDIQEISAALSIRDSIIWPRDRVAWTFEDDTCR